MGSAMGPWRTDILIEVFRGFPQFLLANAGQCPKIRLRLLPTKPSSIHHHSFLTLYIWSSYWRSVVEKQPTDQLLHSNSTDCPQLFLTSHHYVVVAVSWGTVLHLTWLLHSSSKITFYLKANPSLRLSQTIAANQPFLTMPLGSLCVFLGPIVAHSCDPRIPLLNSGARLFTKIYSGIAQ
jgi:hypothetical protein